MKKAKELKEERAKLVEQLEALNTEIGAENEPNEEQRSKFDGLIANIEKLDADIQRAEKVEEIAQRQAASKALPANGMPEEVRGEFSDNEVREFSKASITKMIRSQLKNGKLEGIERELHEEAEKEAREAGLGGVQGVGFPSKVHHIAERQQEMRATMIAETTTLGGHTVQTSVGPLIPLLRPRLQLENMGAQFLTDLQGNLTLPRNDANGSATWEGETDANAEETITLDAVSLAPERLGGYKDFSKQLLFQSSESIDRMVIDSLALNNRIALDLAGINGAGSGNVPTGILNVSGIGSVVGGTNGAVPDWADIVGLETAVAVDNADLGTLGYLTTPGIRGVLKSTFKAANTGLPIWEAGMMPLNGYRAEVSTQVPSDLDKGTSTGVCHAIIFGNFADAIFAQWGPLDIVVDEYTQATAGSIRVVVNGWYDFAVRHPESFAAMVDALLS